jgi:transmembrane sensor
MNRCVETMRAIAQLQDNWADACGVSSTVRERLFAAKPAVCGHYRVRKIVWISATCGALGIAASVSLLWHQRGSALTFAIGNAGARAELGEWVRAPENDTLPLAFSDGTHILLRQSAQARVTETSAHGAHLVLERGGLVAVVAHKEQASWELQAGPFSVLVRGTHFNLDWSPESSTFNLELTEGLVDVVGPGLVGSRAVKTGQRLRVAAASSGWRIESTEIGQSAAPSDAQTAASVASSVAIQAPSTSSAATASTKEFGPAKPGWQELAATGEYAESLAVARKLGLQRICTTSSVADLTRLAQVARAGGDAEVARTVLRSVRERFAGTAEAAMATFDLGRLAFDTSGRFLEAVHWFKDYLREFPHGKLAREAMGRLMEALERGGDHSGAREVANEYLLKYPTGPHVGLAHRLLNP